VALGQVVIKSVNQKTTYWLALLSVLAVALWFRINGFVTGLPFWLDEAYSAYAADKGFEFIFTVLPGYETHPPFYSALLSAWTKIVGNSLFGFRSLGLVAGVLALPLFWLDYTCISIWHLGPVWRCTPTRTNPHAFRKILAVLFIIAGVVVLAP
jgi:hypothetical protein